MELKEAVYFEDEAECTREAAGVVFGMYDSLLEKLPKGKKTRCRGQWVRRLSS